MQEIYVVTNAASGASTEAYTKLEDAVQRVKDLRARDKQGGEAGWYYRLVPLDTYSPTPFNVTFNTTSMAWLAVPLPGTVEDFEESGPNPTVGGYIWTWKCIHGMTRQEAIRKAKRYAGALVEG
jgi:hypothetical protein